MILCKNLDYYFGHEVSSDDEKQIIRSNNN